MLLKVYFPRDVPAFYPRATDNEAWQTLRANLHPDVEIVTGNALPEQPDFHILVAGRPTKEQLEVSQHLKVLVIPWAGVPETTAALMVNYPHISIHNLHHNAIPTAETALMLMFTAAKSILSIEKRFRQHDWRPRYEPNQALILHGKTVLILGYGHIGHHVASVCRASGMNVLAIKRKVDNDSQQEDGVPIHPSDALNDLLPRSQVLIITLPLTDETRGMIGERELALLPPKSVLVNVSRGPIVDQQALYQALKSGHLHSAGLDVWYNYPQDEASRAHTPPADCPFHELDNVVMSPHRGGGSSDIEISRMLHLAELLNAAARGEQVPNQVDLQRGY